MENFSEFWILVVEVWKNGFGGIDIGRLLIASGLLIIFLLARRIFTRVVLSRIKAIVRNTKYNN